VVEDWETVEVRANDSADRKLARMIEERVWDRAKAIVEGVKFMDIPLTPEAYNGVSTGRCTSEDCNLADKSDVPEES
jgi:hypothetical protein